jgi:hypothetical protein
MIEVFSDLSPALAAAADFCSNSSFCAGAFFASSAAASAFALSPSS